MPSIEFLGHAGFLVTEGDTRIAIDPWLSGNPVAKKGEGDIACDHLVITHGHADHFTDVPAIAKRTGATVYCPYEIYEYLNEKGHENCQPMNPGGCVESPFGYVAMTQPVHSSSFEGRYMGVACGAVVKVGKTVIYHTGDTSYFSDIKRIGKRFEPDVMLVCAARPLHDGPEGGREGRRRGRAEAGRTDPLGHVRTAGAVDGRLQAEEGEGEDHAAWGGVGGLIAHPQFR